MPIACSRRIDTRLRECTNASRRLIGPLRSPSKFCGRHAVSADGSSTTTGASRNTDRSEEHTSELQSLMRISYAVFCLKKKTAIKRPTEKYNIPQTTRNHKHNITTHYNIT